MKAQRDSGSYSTEQMLACTFPYYFVFYVRILIYHWFNKNAVVCSLNNGGILYEVRY